MAEDTWDENPSEKGGNRATGSGNFFNAGGKEMNKKKAPGGALSCHYFQEPFVFPFNKFRGEIIFGFRLVDRCKVFKEFSPEVFFGF